MRILPERRHPRPRRRFSTGTRSATDAADTRGDVRRALPLLRARSHAARDQAICRSEGDGMSARSTGEWTTSAARPSTGGTGWRRTLPPGVPQALGRADRVVQRRAEPTPPGAPRTAAQGSTGRETRSSIRGSPSPRTAASRPTQASASSGRASTRRRRSSSPKSSPCRSIASR